MMTTYHRLFFEIHIETSLVIDLKNYHPPLQSSAQPLKANKKRPGNLDGITYRSGEIFQLYSRAKQLDLELNWATFLCDIGKLPSTLCEPFSPKLGDWS